MASRKKTSHAPLALRLTQGRSYAHDIFQLNVPSMTSEIGLDITTFDSERTLILACSAPFHERTIGNGSKFNDIDLAAALRSGLLELVEHDSQQLVRLPPPPQKPTIGRLDIPPHENSAHRETCVGFSFDSTAQIWKNALQPYKTYDLRFSLSGGEAWCYYPASFEQNHLDALRDAMLPEISSASHLITSRRQESLSDSTTSSSEHTTASSTSNASSSSSYGSFAASEKHLAVRRVADIIRFTVYDDPAPPTCFATFSVEPAVCHSSGTPPFKFVTEITLGSSELVDEPVTVSIYDTPFDAGGINPCDDLVRCVDVEIDEEVDFPFRCGLWDGGGPTVPDFPSDDKFVELWPGAKPWRHEFTLKRSSKYGPGWLEYLDVGKRYKVELSPRAQHGFGRWMRGKKEDLLSGSTSEKVDRWESGPRGRFAMPVKQVNGPVAFDVVD